MTPDDPTVELPAPRRARRVPEWTRAKRLTLGAAIAGWLGVTVFLVGGWAERGNTITNLTTTQARNRPTALFNEASFAAQACRRDYDERYFADIASSILVDRSNPDAISAIRASLLRDQQDLAAIRSLCPSPQPPTFDSDGRLLTEPVIPPLVTIPPAPSAGGPTVETTTTTAPPEHAAPAPTASASSSPTTTAAIAPTTQPCTTLPNEKCRKT